MAAGPSETVISLWTRAGLSWQELLRRIGREIVEDDVFGRSAELAYYFLLSAFPLLLCLTSIFGHVMGQRADLRQELFEYLKAVMPTPESLALIQNTLQEVIEQRGLHFSFGLVFSLWAAAQGIVAVGRVLDWAYEVEAERSFLRAQVIAVLLTIGCAVLTLAALALIFYGGAVVDSLAAEPTGGALLTRLWFSLRWPLIVVFLIAAFELIYNFAPSALSRRQLHWTSPGALIGVGLWLGASAGLKVYLARFNLYTWTYGSLGALIILLLWFYLTGFAILVGGEVNSEIVKALAEKQGVAPAALTSPPRPPRTAKARRGRRR